MLIPYLNTFYKIKMKKYLYILQNTCGQMFEIVNLFHDAETSLISKLATKYHKTYFGKRQYYKRPIYVLFIDSYSSIP